VAKVKLLVDTDVLIDFLNTGALSFILDGDNFEVYYSVVTKKELLAKKGLRESERKAIVLTLKRFRVVPLNQRIAEIYARLRREHVRLEKEDALIAATAMTRKLPFLTRNWKHFRGIEGLRLFSGRSEEARRVSRRARGGRDLYARRR
jgi:predicted nucleic acid-binding protein